MFQVFFSLFFSFGKAVTETSEIEPSRPKRVIPFWGGIPRCKAMFKAVSSATPAPPSMGAVLCYAEGRKVDRFSGFTTSTPAINLLVQKISHRTEAYKSEKCFIKFLMVSEFCRWPATLLEYVQLCLKIRFLGIEGVFCVGFMEYLHIVWSTGSTTVMTIVIATGIPKDVLEASDRLEHGE